MRSPLLESIGNGGFPEPPASADIRVICARHDACGAQTRVRLPSEVPARAVRRLRCDSCEQPFETSRVHELGVLESASRPRFAAPVPVSAPAPAPVVAAPEPAPEPVAVERAPEVAPSAPAPPAPPRAKRSAPRPGRPSRPKLSLPKLDPSSRFWKLASIPLAAALVIAGLLALQGGGDEPPGRALPSDQPPGTQAAAAGAGSSESAADADKGAAGDKGSKGSDPERAFKKAKVVAGTGYTLALPAGWERSEPAAGATFAAESSDGDADATLWINDDPKLDFPTFVSQSMNQLESLGDPEIIERTPAPTEEATIVRLGADSPPGQPTYEVTLRMAGSLHYYLATSVDPGASKLATDGVRTINKSFMPDVDG